MGSRAVTGACVVLLGCRRLGAADQVDKRPQVHAGDLDNVVALLAERLRNGPATIRSDVQDDDAQAKVLDLGDDFGEVLVGAGDERVSDRAALRERDDVPAQLALDALAAAWPGVDQAQLEAWHLGERIVLDSAAAIGGFIPVAPQHGQAGAVSRKSGEELQEPGVVPGNGVTAARAVNGHRAICEGIACIDEQGTAIHATPSFPDARRYQRLAAFVTNSPDHRLTGPVRLTAQLAVVMAIPRTPSHGRRSHLAATGRARQSRRGVTQIAPV